MKKVIASAAEQSICPRLRGVELAGVVVVLSIAGCPQLYASIQGSVFSVEGMPIESGIVVLYTPSHTQPSVRFTNETGAYSFSALAAGSYVVEVHAYGSVSQRVTVDVDHDDVVTVDFELVPLESAPAIDATV